MKWKIYSKSWGMYACHTVTIETPLVVCDAKQANRKLHGIFVTLTWFTMVTWFTVVTWFTMVTWLLILLSVTCDDVWYLNSHQFLFRCRRRWSCHVVVCYCRVWSHAWLGHRSEVSKRTQIKSMWSEDKSIHGYDSGCCTGMCSHGNVATASSGSFNWPSHIHTHTHTLDNGRGDWTTVTGQV